MNWNEFKKSRKRMTYKVVMTNRYTYVESIQGYPFEEGTFIARMGDDLYAIYDIETGELVSMFKYFEELMLIWKTEIKEKLINFKKTKKYKLIVAKFKERVEKENE